MQHLACDLVIHIILQNFYEVLHFYLGRPETKRQIKIGDPYHMFTRKLPKYSFSGEHMIECTIEDATFNRRVALVLIMSERGTVISISVNFLQ